MPQEIPKVEIVMKETGASKGRSQKVLNDCGGNVKKAVERIKAEDTDQERKRNLEQLAKRKQLEEAFKRRCDEIQRNSRRTRYEHDAMTALSTLNVRELSELVALARNPAAQEGAAFMVEHKWETIHEGTRIVKPFLWALLSWARRNPRMCPSWCDFQPPPFDCLYYNNMTTCVKRSEHRDVHVCICCGSDSHPIFDQTLNLSTWEIQSSSLCPVWKTLATQFNLVAWHLRVVDRTVFEQVLFGKASSFAVEIDCSRELEAAQQQLQKQLEGLDKASTASGPQRAVQNTLSPHRGDNQQDTVAEPCEADQGVDEHVLDTETGCNDELVDTQNAAATENPDCGQETPDSQLANTAEVVVAVGASDSVDDAGDTVTDRGEAAVAVDVPESTTVNPVTSRATADDSAVLDRQAFFEEYIRRLPEAKRKLAHDMWCFPNCPAQGSPFLVFCRCCSVGSKSRHSVHMGLYFATVGHTWSPLQDAQPAVVKVFEHTSGTPSAEFERECGVFSRAYPGEMLEACFHYEFTPSNSGSPSDNLQRARAPISFICTRRHDVDLKVILETEGQTMTTADRLELVRKALRAVQKATLVGLTHGDIKPHNIVRTIVKPFDTVEAVGSDLSTQLQLIDFEFSIWRENDDVSVSAAAGYTEHWASPLQQRTKQLKYPVGYRDDCWSLALVIYEIFHCGIKRTETVDGVPLFFCDLANDACSETVQFNDALDDVLETARNQARKRVRPPVPRNCNKFISTIIESLLDFSVSGELREKVERSKTPLTVGLVSVRRPTHLLMVPFESMALMLLGLYHQLSEVTAAATLPKVEYLLGLNRGANKVLPLLERSWDLSQREWEVPAANRSKFNPSIKMTLVKALGYLRNLIAHPALPAHECIATFVDCCPGLLTDVQTLLDASGAVYDLATNQVRIDLDKAKEHLQNTDRRAV